MRCHPTLLPAIALLVAALTPAAAQSGGDLPRWMEGCWAGERGGERFSERWFAADGTVMLGVSHTTATGRLKSFEFLRVVLRRDRLVYVAQPDGAPPTEFTASPGGVTGDAVTFANPSHDFPKRIGYRRTDANRLVAWIDGGPGSASSIEFPMSRVTCQP